MLSNPMYSEGQRLEFARGAIKFRNEVIANLRRRLAEAGTALSHGGDGGDKTLGHPAVPLLGEKKP